MVIHLFNFKTLLRAFCLTGTIIKKEDTAGNILDKTVAPHGIYSRAGRERDWWGAGQGVKKGGRNKDG